MTAEHRKANLQKTAASVTVRRGEDLARQGRYTSRQILDDIPGIVAVDNNSINVGSNDIQGDNFTIRGVSQGDLTLTGRASSAPNGLSSASGTAVYVDGVYEGIGSGYDIDRVEVLRGPQGTLYGRSATSGVVAFHTRNPTLGSYNGIADVEFGDYDLQHYSAAVNIPLGATLAARLSGDYRDQGEGYYGQAGSGMARSTNARAKLLWEPNDKFSLLLGVAYGKNDAFSGGKSTTAAPPTLALTTLSSPTFPSTKLQRQYWAELNWDAGPVKLTYLPAFRSWQQNDHIFVDANFVSSGDSLNQGLRAPKDNFLTQELRVASADDALLQWQAGVFYYRNAVDKFASVYVVNPNGGGRADLSDTEDHKTTENLGYFAEATVPLGASTRLTLGARYDDTKLTINEFYYDNIYGLCGTSVAFAVPPGTVCTGVATATVPAPPGTSLNGSLNFHNFNYKARLEHDLTSKNMLYAMISTGSRPGDLGIANGAPNYLAAEKLTSIEIGSKNRFLDNSLQLNAALYYYNYQGFQTWYVPDTSPTAVFGINNTVAITVPAHNLGGEMELLYKATALDTFGLNADYVQSRWYNKPAAFALAQPETTRALTPYTITANYEHMFNLAGGSAFSARIDGRYEAAHLNQNLQVDWLMLGYGPYVRLSARAVGNLTGTWVSASGRSLISGYVHNFTNSQYITRTVGGDPTALYVNWSDPLTFGVTLSEKF